MAKAILEFDLTDAQDREEFTKCNKAHDAHMALWEMAQAIRNWCKYDERNDIPTDEIHAKFYDILGARDVSLD